MMRCSRFCLTLFSCPEYVLIAYQENMVQVAFLLSDDEVDGLVGHPVDQAEVEPGDDHEADDDRGGV